MGLKEVNVKLMWSLRVLFFVVFFGLWELGAREGFLDPFFFSSPSDIAKMLVSWFSGTSIYYDIYITLLETLEGFVIGVVGGVVLGFLFARSQLLAAVFEPLIVALNAMPKLALGPLFIIWFGIGLSSKVAMGVAVVLFVVFFNTYQGVREVNQDLVNNARILGGSSYDVFKHVLLPAALSWIFSSLRTSIGFALIGAVVGEYMVAQNGIGHLIATAQGNFDTSSVFTGLIVLMVLVYVLDVLIQRVERRLSRWRASN